MGLKKICSVILTDTHSPGGHMMPFRHPTLPKKYLLN